MMVFIFILLIIILCIYIRSNSPQIKGRVGEKKISKKIHSLPEEYLIYDDIYILVNGHSVQIDHLIISKYGIFVIETKNYTGWIYGNEKSDYWTKNMYGKKYRFRNPLKQNFSHVKSLEILFGASDFIFVPLVVFLDKAYLKTYHPNIIYASNLLPKILSRKTVVLSDDDIKRYAEILKSSMIVSKERKKQHVNYIKTELSEKELLVDSGICPKCKGHLVERNGENGSFLGCSNYPKCRFTANL